MTKTRFSELTKYPKIYENVYWGNFTGELNREILKNRNLFINNFNIKSQVKKTRKLPQYLTKIADRNVQEYVDHAEYYITNDNNYYIILISPYNHVDKNLVLQDGWIETDPMYSKNAYTFYKRIEIRKR